MRGRAGAGRLTGLCEFPVTLSDSETSCDASPNPWRKRGSHITFPKLLAQ